MQIVGTLALVAALAQAPAAPPPFKASANPVSDAFRDFAARYSKTLIRSAELMPADPLDSHEPRR